MNHFLCTLLVALPILAGCGDSISSSQYDIGAYEDYLERHRDDPSVVHLVIQDPASCDSFDAEAVAQYVGGRFFYITDHERYNVDDYWAGPDESIETDDPYGEFWDAFQGDCEDFSLFVYFYLAEQSIESNIIVVRAAEYDDYHIIIEVCGVVFDSSYPREFSTPEKLQKERGYAWVAKLKTPQLDSGWEWISSY